MRILISGASGFIGAPLCSYLLSRGHDIAKLVRHVPLSSQEIQWDPGQGKASKASFEGFDAIIHLSGEPLSLTRWTSKKKREILYSRTVSTWFLSQIVSSLCSPPKVFISASAVNFYGDRGEELLDETAPPGQSFLSSVCMEWEKASQAIANRGARTLQTRFGLVIDSHGGIMKKMRPLYHLGLGALFGTGEQWISWISLADLLHAMDFLLHSSLEGPILLVSPHPVRQKEFSQTLAHLLCRPVYLKIPSWILSCAFGQAAKELLLTSIRAVPSQLLSAGFSFKYPHLSDAMKNLSE